MATDPMRLRPSLTYRDRDTVADKPLTHVTAQGIDLELSPGMIALAEAEGGVTTQCMIAREPIRTVFGMPDVEGAMRITVDIEPVPEEERHNPDDED